MPARAPPKRLIDGYSVSGEYAQPAKLEKKPDQYNPRWAAAAAGDKALRGSKARAELEQSEDEEGWLLEASDDAVLDTRYELDKRLAWIRATSERIAPLVKAQFRRALVQDKELRRRRARLEARAAETVEIVGGIGTGVIHGEAFIPAVPTPAELAAAKVARTKQRGELARARERERGLAGERKRKLALALPTTPVLCSSSGAAASAAGATGILGADLPTQPDPHRRWPLFTPGRDGARA